VSALEYINSGLLELYVLQQTTAEQALEVERAAEAYPEVQAELLAIAQSLEQLAEAEAINPPTGLLDIILVKAAAEAPPPRRPSWQGWQG
jgi:hypothetical protein